MSESADFSRYHRQMLLPGIGQEGQRRLAGSTAVVLGCGALGSVSADMLVRAGVGHVIIVDRDFVELTNLQRQVLFDESDVEQHLPKAEAARRKLQRINSSVQVTAVVDDINFRNIHSLTQNADVLVDGLDNFETRYLVNDLSVSRSLPYVYAGAVGTTGMACSFLPHTGDRQAAWEQDVGGGATACFRCLFEEPPAPGQSPTCDTAGVLGPVVALVANFQVAEALKILVGAFERVSRTLLNVDLWTNSISQLDISSVRDHVDCPVCKQGIFDYLEGRSGSGSSVLCGRNAVQLHHRNGERTVDFDQLANRLEVFGPVTVNELMLRANIRDGETDYELSLFRNGRAIIKGTDDPGVARGVYARFVGD